MADRTVRVVLKASVASFVRDVATATVAVEQLRKEAERFERRYKATLVVDTREATAGMRQAERQMGRSASRMRASIAESGKALTSQLRKLQGELAELERNGVDVRLAAESDSIRREIAKVKSHLASLNHQKITIEVASQITEGNIELANLEDRLRRLDRSTFEPEVRLKADQLRRDIAGVQASLLGLRRQRADLAPGSFAAGLRRQLEGALRALPDVEINADSSRAEREIAEVRAALQTLADKRIGVDIDSATALAEARALRARLQSVLGGTSSARFQVDAKAAIDELGKLDGATSRAASTIARASRENDRFHRGLFHTARNAADTARALRTLSIPPALMAAGPALGSLAGDLMAVGQAAAALPALGFATAAAFGTIAIGLKDWKAVTKEMGKGKLEKARKAAEELSPAAKAAAHTLLDLAKAYDQAAHVVQEALFKNVSRELRELAAVGMPLIKTRMAGIGQAINEAAVAFSDFATRADTVKDADQGLLNIQKASIPLSGIMVNLAAGIRDFGLAGSRELPAMAAGFEVLTERFRDWAAESRANGDINRWIQTGIDKIMQFGRVTANFGSIFGSVFRAADQSGLNFLDTIERVSFALKTDLKTPAGQLQLLEFFREMRVAGQQLLPGLRAIGDALGGAFDRLSDAGVFREAARSLSDLAVSAAPVLEMFGALVSNILPPFLSLVQGIAPALGPVLGVMLAWKGMSRVLNPVRDSLDGLAGRADRLRDRFGGAAVAVDGAARKTSGLGVAAGGAAGPVDKVAGSAGRAETNTSKLGRAMGGVSRALPGIGLAVLGMAGAYEALRDRSGDAADAIMTGQMSITKAIEEEVAALERQQSVRMIDPGYAQGLALLGEDMSEAAVNARNWADAEKLVFGQLEKKKAALPPLAAANAEVSTAQAFLNHTLERFPPTSQQVQDAAARLTAANDKLELEQYAAALGTDTHTAAIRRNGERMLEASSAEIGYHGALSRATEAVALNGRTIDINTEQGRNNRAAVDELARAALRDVDAKRAQEGQTQAVTDKGYSHQRQLYDTMIQMGYSRGEAREYVAQLGLVPPEQTTRFFTPGLPEAITKVSELAGLINGMQNTGRENLRGAVTDAVDAVRRVTGRRAQGGPVHGPGSTTSDSIPMRLSNGEWVMRARAVQEQGHDRMALLNAGLADIVPKGAELPGRARGGPVTTDVVLDFRGVAEHVARVKNEMFPPMPAWSGGAGVEQWRGVVRQALAIMGQPMTYDGITLRRMAQESGGNPTIGNFWDSNWRKGTPSMGLMQVIGPTYRRYRHPAYDFGPYAYGTSLNPLSNILASMRYALGRYGSLPAAYNKPGGYHDGGVVPGTGEGYALVKGGERVLTTGQTTAFDRLVDVLDRPTPVHPLIAAGTRGGDGATTNVEIHNENHFREAVDIDLFSGRMDFAVRSLTF